MKIQKQFHLSFLYKLNKKTDEIIPMDFQLKTYS